MMDIVYIDLKYCEIYKYKHHRKFGVVVTFEKIEVTGEFHKSNPIFKFSNLVEHGNLQGIIFTNAFGKTYHMNSFVSVLPKGLEPPHLL